MQNSNKWIARSTIIYIFITNIDFLVVLPLIPRLIIGDNVATQVAGILGLRVGISLFATSIVSVLFKNASHRTIMLSAAILKSLSFLLLLSPSIPALYIFSILTGIGTGFLKPSVRAVLSDVTTGERQKKYFQYMFIAMNASFVVGPVISEYIPKEFWFLTFIVLSLLELSSGIQFFTLFGKRSSVIQTKLALGSKVLEALKTSLMPAYLLSFTTYCAMGFMISSFVLYESYVPNLAGWRNFFLSFEGFSLIVVQLVLVRIGWFKGLHKNLSFGAISLLLGMILSFSGNLQITFIGLIIFAFGECLLLPLTQTLAAKNSKDVDPKMVFSLVTILATLGEITGTFFSGLILDISIFDLASNQKAILIGGLLGALNLLIFLLAGFPKKNRIDNMALGVKK